MMKSGVMAMGFVGGCCCFVGDGAWQWSASRLITQPLDHTSLASLKRRYLKGHVISDSS